MWGAIKRQNLWSLGTDEDKESHDRAWTRSSTKSYKKTSPRGKKNENHSILYTISAPHPRPHPCLLVCGPETCLWPHHLAQCRAGRRVRYIYVPLAHAWTYASTHPGPPGFCALCSFPTTLRLLGPLPLTVGHAWKVTCLK